MVYQGKKFDVATEDVMLPGGTTVCKEVILHRGAAVMIPLLSRERVCLVRNYRHAIGMTLLELPAGTLDPGESFEQAAFRELQEETGYKAQRARQIIEFYPSPGILNERMAIFVMEDLSRVEMKLDAGEQLEPVEMQWSEVVRELERGTICDAKSMIGIMLWDRLREA
jgi:ADP-ribose pyrophosphatase